MVCVWCHSCNGSKAEPCPGQGVSPGEVSSDRPAVGQAGRGKSVGSAYEAVGDAELSREET